MTIRWSFCGRSGNTRELNTPAKTGLPGAVKPRNYTPFVSFSIDLFDALERCGWTRLDSRVPKRPSAGGLAIESFPMAAWKAVGLPPLPAKSKVSDEDLARWITMLKALFPVSVPEGTSHDDLQAVVSGLAGIGALNPDLASYSVAGVAPVFEGGTWREGYILNPGRVGRGFT